MVSKSKKEIAGKKKKVKVLNLNKETIKDLTDEEAKGVKGGTTQCIGTSGATSGSVRGQSSLVAGSSVVGSGAGNTNTCGFQSYGGGFGR